MNKLNNKKIIIILSLLIIIFIGITTYFVVTSSSNETVEKNKINLEDININDDTNKNNLPVSTKYALKDRYETYNENSLTTNLVYDDAYKLESLKVEGLKNKEVENKINKEISALIKDGNKCIITGNFSNVLSVECSKYDLKNIVYDYSNLNYNLIDGTQLKLSDIFVDGYNPQQLLASAIYDELYTDIEVEYARNYENLTQDELKKERDKRIANIENETLKYFNEYKKGNYQLSFSSIDVTFIINNKRFIQNFIDKPEVVAIFKRFLTEKSLFENDTIGNRNLNFGIETGNFRIKLKENVLIDISLSGDVLKDTEKMAKAVFEKYLLDTPLATDEAMLISGYMNFQKSENPAYPEYYSMFAGQCGIEITIVKKNYFNNLFPNQIVEVMQNMTKYEHKPCIGIANSKFITDPTKNVNVYAPIHKYLVNSNGNVIKES